jgi:CHAD domain-containing protein
MTTPTRALRYISSNPELLAQLQQGLPAPYTLVVEQSIAQPAAILDTFDDDLLQREQILVQTPGNLQLIDLQSASAPLPQRKPVAFVNDIDSEQLRGQLDFVSELRRLLPYGNMTLCHSSASLLDDNQKTCARMLCAQFQAGKRQVVLLQLQALRGYDKPSAMLQQRLQELQAEPINGSLQLVQALGYAGHEYVNNPTIELAPTASVIESANLIVSTYLTVARRNEPGIVDDLDTEFLHDFRVSLRRVRSVISLFKGVWEEQVQQDLKRRFSEVMRTTNRLRDLDVYLLDQPGYYAELPLPMHAGVDLIFAAFARERAQQWRALAKYLRSDAYQQEIAALQALFVGDTLKPGVHADENVLEYACKLIRKRYKKVCQVAGHIHPGTPDEEVHELRLQCKKLRYLLDFFRPLLPAKDVRRLIKSLKRLQDNLGRFNDYSAQQLSLQGFLDQRLASNKPVNPKMIEAIGALVALKHQMQMQERAQVMNSFATFNSEETRRAFHQLCSVPAIGSEEE